MIIKVYGTKENVGFWTYESFKEHHKAIVMDYKNNGNLIEHITYKIEKPIDEEFTKSCGLTYEIIE